MWLGTRTGIYKAQGMPNINGTQEVQTVLDLDDKAMSKIYLQHYDCESQSNLCGYDLSDGAVMEWETEEEKIKVEYGGYTNTAIRCADGELLFYDEALLAPLQDVFKKSWNVELCVRMAENGVRYIVVKDGMEAIAAIMPLDFLKEQFLHELAEYESHCVEQYERQEARKSRIVHSAEKQDDERSNE